MKPLLNAPQDESLADISLRRRAQEIALATYLNEWPEAMQFDAILEEMRAAEFGAWVETHDGRITIAEYYEDWNLATLASYIDRLADSIKAEFRESSA